MKIVILISFLFLYSFNVFAQSELSGGGNSNESLTLSLSDNSISSAPQGPYSQGLSCINQIDHRLSLNANDNGSPESNPAIFSGRKDGVFGIYVVKPNITTFTPVTKDTFHPKGYSLGYHFAYSYPDGRTRLYHFYDDEDDGRGNAASSFLASNLQEGNADTNFEPVGRASDRLDRTGSNLGISNEATASLSDLPERFLRSVRYIQEDDRIYREQADKDAEKARRMQEVKDALCSCLKTTDQRIIAAAKDAASRLSLSRDEDIVNCQTPLIGFKSNYIELLLSLLYNKGYAAEIKKTKKHDQLLSFDEPLKGFKRKKNNLLLCGLSKSWLINIENGSILKTGKKCSKKTLKKTSQKTATKNAKITIKDKNLKIQSI